MNKLEPQKIILKTLNGEEIADFSQKDWGVNGRRFITGKFLSGSHFPYGIWDFKGKCQYVHNCDKLDLSGFDLIGFTRDLLEKIIYLEVKTITGDIVILKNTELSGVHSGGFAFGEFVGAEACHGFWDRSGKAIFVNGFYERDRNEFNLVDFSEVDFEKLLTSDDEEERADGV